MPRKNDSVQLNSELSMSIDGILNNFFSDRCIGRSSLSYGLHEVLIFPLASSQAVGYVQNQLRTIHAHKCARKSEEANRCWFSFTWSHNLRFYTLNNKYFLTNLRCFWIWYSFKYIFLKFDAKFHPKRTH